MTKFIDIKRKILSLFQSGYIQLQSVVSSITSWKHTVQAVPSKKKKKREASGRKKERERERKERGGKKDKKKKGRKEFVRKEREKGRMRCGKKDEKEGEGERRGRERRIKNRRGKSKSVPPPPDVFPSTKLGNNITPIKGRLGKNTTPTSREPVELSQNLQMNPPQRRSSFEIASRTNLVYTP